MTSLLQLITPLHGVSAQETELPVYIIQSGDTLFSIALRFNVSPDDIIKVNGIADANLLNLGDRIKIPGLEGISGVLTSFVIPLGVNLTSLSRNNQISSSDLVTLNKYTSPAEVAAGIKMIIPVKDEPSSIKRLSTVSVNENGMSYAIHNDINPWQIKLNNKLKNTLDYFSNEVLFYTPGVDQTSSSSSLLESVSTTTLPIIQGQTMEIMLNTSETVDISASLAGQTLSFFKDTTNQYVALHGIHAMTEPGLYPIEITIQTKTGQRTTFDQLLLVTEGGYVQDPVIFVDDIYVEQDTIEIDDAKLNQIISQITPTRYWEGTFQSPITDPTCVVGYYGNRRSYNDGALFYYHTGIDFSVCIAENLYAYAPAKGKVMFAEETVIRGNAVIIDHGWGVFSGYWHLSEIAVNVGDMLNPGDLIGVIGNTGRSAGPHLHFEMIVSGTAVNPLEWLSVEYP